MLLIIIIILFVISRILAFVENTRQDNKRKYDPALAGVEAMKVYTQIDPVAKAKMKPEELRALNEEYCKVYKNENVKREVIWNNIPNWKKSK